MAPIVFLVICEITLNAGEEILQDSRGFFQIIDIADARETTARIQACGRSIYQFLGVCPAIWYADVALAAFLLFKMFTTKFLVCESLSSFV